MEQDHEADADANDVADTPPRATAWLSRGLEALVEALPQIESAPHAAGFDFDVVIVGSGYGAAVAASQLAGLQQGGRPITVCVLERGNEYLRGMFPARLSDPAGHARFATPNAGKAGGRRDVLHALAGSTARARAVPITVAARAGANGGNTLLDACVGCGDCATGCNHNAKDSLDLNLLRLAHDAGARIVSGATVLRVEKLGRDG